MHSSNSDRLQARLRGEEALEPGATDRLMKVAPLIAFALGAVAFLLANTLVFEQAAPPERRLAIMFYTSPSCGWCKKIKREDLPEWRGTQTAALTLVSERDPVRDCQADGSRGAACRAVYGGGARFFGVPAFALVDLETGRTLTKAKGYKGFDRVTAAATRTLAERRLFN